MRALIIAMFLCLAGLPTPEARAAIDQVFTKPGGSRDWGEILASYFTSDDLKYRKSYALVVGISDFDGFRDLPTAEDPIRVKNYLLNEAGFDHVHLLTEDAVTLERLREIMLDDLANRIGPDDRFVFYWSGHGHTIKDRDGKPVGYLPTSVSTPDRPSRMIDMDAIARWDRSIRARQVLYLLDSCFSGHAGSAPQSGVRKRTLRQMARPSRHIITAGTEGEQTIATERLQGSIFTHAVLEGLRGRADTASAFERDGIVTVNELEDYVKKRVDELRDEANWIPQITPQVWDLGANEGEFFFVSAAYKRERLEDENREFAGAYQHGIPKSHAPGPPKRQTTGGGTTDAPSPAPAPGGPAKFESIARAEDWSAFVAPDPKTCWATTKPLSFVARRDGRVVPVNIGDVLFMSSYIPENKIAGQIAVHAGFPVRGVAKLTIGSERFELFSQDEWLWPASNTEDDKIRGALEANTEAVLTATSSRGTDVEFKFSAKGFFEANIAAKAVCAN